MNTPKLEELFIFDNFSEYEKARLKYLQNKEQNKNFDEYYNKWLNKKIDHKKYEIPQGE